jgi:hypothetical protein
VRLLAARTRQASLAGSRDFKLQQFRQGRCSGLMHGRPDCQLDGFQIKTAGFAAIVEDHA